MGAVHFSLDVGLARLFQQQLQIGTLVETGTFEGDTVAAMAGLFARICSVEASAHYFQQAGRRLAGVPGVTLFHGASAAFLRAHAEEFRRTPVLYWLDAHWCSAEHTSGLGSQSPLLDELAAIGGLHADSVVLVDDARLYLCPPPRPHHYHDWPDWHDVTAALLALSPAHRLMVLNDVVVFYPARLRAALAAYAFEHGTDWLTVANTAREHARRRRRWFFR